MPFGSASSVRVHNDDLPRRAILDECDRLNGSLWEDRVFAAQGDHCLYLPGSKTRYAGGQKIKWLRPNEVAGAGGKPIELIKDGADAGDVIQGELGDCYLLGAMSSIAAKGMLSRLLWSEADVAGDLKRGFITFKLYKFGEWVQVSVDTLLPCNAADECIFAHAKDPTEVWVPLLEKAYAKLHGSYEALDGGSVTAALADLTGGIGESIDMTDDDFVLEIADGSMWKRLLRYATKPNYLLGAALSQGSVPDAGGEGDVQVTEFGVLVNHAYTLLAVREVGESYAEKTRLLQLRNPWGMREWEGPWRDNGTEWETAAGKRARAELGVEFKEDGTFWIEWADFQMHFNKIYVCRALAYEVFDEVKSTFVPGYAPEGADQTWFRYEIEGEWTAENAGGCFNFPDWRKNPQYEIRTEEETDALFLLMQPDPRMEGTAAPASSSDGPRGGDEGGPKYDKKIGMYLMKGHDQMRRKVLYDSEEIDGDDVVDSTPFIEYREVQCNTMDEEEEGPLKPYQRFVLCPSTFQPGMLGRFRIIVLTAKPLAQPPELLAPLRELSSRGAWTERSAGGCRNYVSWRTNEQYLLRLCPDARASVVLVRATAAANANQEQALFSNKKSRGGSKKRKAKDKTNFLIGFVVARSGSAGRKKLEIVEEEVVDKTSYTNNFEVAREFLAEGGGDFVIVPSTFEPGKLGEYRLVVYTDDERATMARIEPSGWHTQSVSGEWAGRSAGGSRNYPSWVRNPLFKLRAQRGAYCEAFLRQPDVAESSEAGFHGIGFYVTSDDGDLNLEDVAVETGFRMRREVSAGFQLDGDVDYLLIPMTYRRGIEEGFEIDIFSDQPSLRLTKLSEYEANSRRIPAMRQDAALTIQRWLARKQIWAELRGGNRMRAKELMNEWFRKPNRDNDEGYLDINLALNALESAFIQLTGKAEAKGAFFPRMRERLATRGHKVADYDVCLRD